LSAEHASSSWNAAEASFRADSDDLPDAFVDWAQVEEEAVQRHSRRRHEVRRLSVGLALRGGDKNPDEV
jgi:hypothetical protein